MFETTDAFLRPIALIHDPKVFQPAKPFVIVVRVNNVDFPLSEGFMNDDLQREFSQKLEEVGVHLLKMMGLEGTEYTVRDMARCGAMSSSWFYGVTSEAVSYGTIARKV